MNKIIIGPGYPLRGGISESNQALYESFVANKELIQLISYSLQYPHFLFPGKTQVVDNEIDHCHNSISMINTLNPFSWFKTVKYIFKQKPHYVIVRYWHPYFAICLSIICRFLQYKSIFVIA